MKNWVAITGASGFVGGYISETLHNAGYSVAAICRTEPRIALDRFYKADITDKAELERVVSDMPDFLCVVHAAASLRYDENAIIVNCLGTYNVLKILGQKTGNICNISSIPIIGTPEILPITEEHTANPLNIYHMSKYQAELICGLPEFGDLEITTLRFASPIGVGMSGKLILTAFIKCCLNNVPIRLYGQGLRQQNYIDARDIAKAVKLIVETSGSSGLYLLKGHTISNYELANLCRSITDSQSQIQYAGVDDPQEKDKWVIDGSKAERELGFTAQISLEQTIKEIGESMKCV